MEKQMLVSNKAWLLVVWLKLKSEVYTKELWKLLKDKKLGLSWKIIEEEWKLIKVNILKQWNLEKM